MQRLVNMPHHRLIAKRLFFSILLSALVFTGNGLMAQDGKALFQADCASCHHPTKIVTGPALQGVTERVPDTKLLHAWIRNNGAVLASGNKYFNDLFAQYNKTPMNIFPTLTDGEIDAILKYVNDYKEAPKVVDGSNKE